MWNEFLFLSAIIRYLHREVPILFETELSAENMQQGKRCQLYCLCKIYKTAVYFCAFFSYLRLIIQFHKYITLM